MVPAVVKPPTDMTAATPSQTKFGELIETLVIVTGQSQIPERYHRPGRSPMKVGSRNYGHTKA